MTLTMRDENVKPAGRWESIQLGDGDGFEVCVRGPSYAELVNEMEATDGFVARRFDLVTDWRGVERRVELNGDAIYRTEPVPFSQDALRTLCEQFPAAFRQVCAVLQRRFYGLPEVEAKNSEAPPAGS